MKLPRLDLPRPVRWDWLALVVLLVGGALLAAVLGLVSKKAPGTSLSDALTTGCVVAELLVSVVGLLILGKTAKEGTLWGNLFAIGGMLVGVSGVLLAAAMWAAA